MPNKAITSLNAGEFTSKIDARADVEKYARGCRKLENMIPLIFGGVERRPGTEYISNTATFDTMIADILAYENAGLAYEGDVVNTSYDTFLAQILCYENDILCHENEIVVDTRLMSRTDIVVCYENSVVFYENEIVIYE